MRFNEYYFDEESLDEKITADTDVGKPIGKAVGTFFRSLGLGKKSDAVDMKSMKYKQIVTVEDLNKIDSQFIQPLRNKDLKLYIKNVYNLKPLGNYVDQFRDILKKTGIDTVVKSVGKLASDTYDQRPGQIDTTKESYESYVMNYLTEAGVVPSSKTGSVADVKDVIGNAVPGAKDQSYKFTGGSVYKSNHGGKIVLMNLRDANDEDIHILAADEKGNDLFRQQGYTFNSLLSTLKTGQKGKFSPDTIEVGDLVTFKFKGGTTKDFYVFKIDTENKKFIVTTKEQDRMGDHDGIEVKSNVGDGTGLSFNSAVAIKEAGASAETKQFDPMVDPRNVQPGDTIEYKQDNAKATYIVVKSFGLKDDKKKSDPKNKANYSGEGSKNEEIAGKFFIEIFKKGEGNTMGLPGGDNQTSNKPKEEPSFNQGDNPDLQTSGTDNEEPKKERVDKGRINGNLALVNEKQYKSLINDFDAYIKKDSEGDENYIKFKREDKKEPKSNWEGIKYTTDIGNIYIQHDAINTEKTNPVVIFSNEKILYDILDQGLLQGLMNSLQIEEQILLDRIKWKNK